MAIWAALIPGVVQLLDKLIPDPEKAAEAKIKLLQLQQSGELAQMDADVKLALGQMDINKVEAASPDNFRAGWRPAAGWICVLGLGYTFLLRPLLPWVVAVVGLTPPPLPAIETGELMVLLLGMLGLGSMRTMERIKGTA